MRWTMMYVVKHQSIINRANFVLFLLLVCLTVSLTHSMNEYIGIQNLIVLKILFLLVVSSFQHGWWHISTHITSGASLVQRRYTQKTLKWKDDTYCLSHLTSLNWWCFLFRHSLFSFFFFREKINLCSNIHHRCPNLSLTLFCSRILILKRRRKVRFDVISVTMFDPNHFSLHLLLQQTTSILIKCDTKIVFMDTQIPKNKVCCI